MSSPSSSANATPTRIHNPIDAAFTEIRSSPFFLGSTSILQRVQWDRGNSGIDTLVQKPPDGDDNAPRSEAILSWIGQLDSSEFWLYICGGWNNTTGPLHKAKARAIVVPGTRYTSIRTVWPTLTNNVAALQKACQTHGAQPVTLLKKDGIQIRHILFDHPQKIDEPDYTDTETATESATSAADEPFAMQNWTCRNEVAQAALEELVAGGEYEGCILPAYTESGDLIPPRDYEARLRGAYVLVKAAMSHQYIKSETKDNWYLDIRELHVVKPPPPTPASPAKRTTKQILDDAKGKKKQRT
ncbi:hypothetical protein B0H21DRAFT_823609 [Amylocystis lapponica]|nr:hypothetical protein B0H21DRAFT_823609 [Amylocystis lapponica]